MVWFSHVGEKYRLLMTESFAVNFVGPNDEFVVSGSEEGYFFLWRRETGALHGIYEGDGSVVNVIEAHPTLPLLAVSGIDHEPKASPPLTRACCLRLTPRFSCLAPAKERMSGRGSTGRRISSPTTWAASSFPRYSHSSRRLSVRRAMARWILNVRTSEESEEEFTLYHYRCILSTNPCCTRIRFRQVIGITNF
jgi:hypothetical protein